MKIWMGIVGVGVALAVALGIYFQPRLGAAPALAGFPSGATGGAELMRSSSSAFAADDPATGGVANGIVVVGEGSVDVAPDVAFVTVGVQTRAQTAKEAQDQNNTTMAAVLAQVKALNIDEKDIQTSGVSLHPVMERENTVTGYQASNSVTVRVADVSQVGPVLDAAVAGGANTAGSVRFGLKDPAAADRQALDAAVKDARSKADAVAKALGVQIKGVGSVVEIESGGPSPVWATEMMARADAATPIQPGQVAVTARLRVVYSY